MSVSAQTITNDYVESTLSKEQSNSAPPWACGTVVTPEYNEQIERWLSDGTWERYSSRDLSGIRGNITIKVIFHIVQEDDGSGNTLTADFCQVQIDQMNENVFDIGIEFCIEDILYHPDSDYTTVVAGDSSTTPSMGFVSDSLNVYCVPTLMGAGAFAVFPPDRLDMVIDDDYMFPGHEVFGHELGHFFGLVHTFQGGDECVDGSNCATAGDFMCCTPADYGGSQYDGSCNYIGGGVDGCNGDPYNPDGENLMSYGSQTCMDYFCEDQLSLFLSIAEVERANVHGLCTAAQFDFPDGLPLSALPTEPTTIQFSVEEGNEAPITGSVKVVLNVNGTEEILDTTFLGSEEYEVTLPGFSCDDVVNYYFEVQCDGGTVVLDPEDPGIEQHSLIIGIVNDEVIFTESFTTGYPSDWSTSGIWTMTYFCAPSNECDGPPFAYFGNAANCNYNVNNDPVSGSVITPEISIAGYEGTILFSFCNALQTEYIDGGDYDLAELYINGSLVERVEDSSYWEILEYDLTDIDSDTIQIEWRFDSVDGQNNDYRGWHFDGVQIVSRTVECVMPDPTGACCVGLDCSVITQTDCKTSGGTYLGDDTTCEDDPCTATGACCIDTNCSVVSQSDCESANGTYFGDDSSCANEVCGDCVVSDDFGTNTGLWALDTNRPEIMAVSDSNNQLDFWAPSENTGFLDAMAVAMSDGWKVDMTQDWAFSANWKISPPTPDYGDVGIAFVLALEGDMDNFYIERGYTLGGGVAYDPNFGFVDHYETTNLWYDGVRVIQTEYDRYYTTNTTYIWYDASTQRIYYNDALYVPFDAGVSLAGLSSETEAWVGFAGYNFGLVPAFSTGSLWADDVCMIDGSIIVESNCPADLNDDAVIDVIDLLLVIDEWGSTGGNADINGDGIVDVVDLLEIVGNWGPCT